MLPYLRYVLLTAQTGLNKDESQMLDGEEWGLLCLLEDIDSSVLILPKCSTVGLPSETRSISVCECLLPLWRGTRLYNRDFGVQGELFEPSFFLPEVKVETYVNCTPCQHHGLYLLKWCFAQPRQNVPVHPWGRGIKKLWDGNLCVLQSSSIINVDLRPGFYFSFFYPFHFILAHESSEVPDPESVLSD